MTKIDTLRRFLLLCFAPAATPSAAAATNTKKRLSTSLRDDIEDPPQKTLENLDDDDKGDKEESTTSDESTVAAHLAAPPRHSMTMVIGTIFGQRRGHVWFCVQHDRFSTRPALLLKLPIPTGSFLKPQTRFAVLQNPNDFS